MSLLEAAGRQIPPELCRVDELTPFAVEFRYDTVTFDERFDRRNAREPGRGFGGVKPPAPDACPRLR